MHVDLKVVVTLSVLLSTALGRSRSKTTQMILHTYVQTPVVPFQKPVTMRLLSTVHTDVRPFKCSGCIKGFQKQALGDGDASESSK